MAIRSILHYPDTRLRIVAKPVSVFDAALETLVLDMAETMYAAPGVGLAATQIGEDKRVFIVDLTTGEEGPNDLRVFVNPEIVDTSGDIVWDEGCLSFPGLQENVKRAAHVRVRAQDVQGTPFELEAEGLFAVAIQHELDHLDGKLMIDHVSPLKRRIMHRTMLKRKASA